MSMTDPISDMLTRIRNAILARHRRVVIPGSKMKRRIADIMVREGFLQSLEWNAEAGPSGALEIELKWLEEVPAIEGLERVSRPGQRKYARSDEIPQVRNGLGIMIVSTSRGLMTDRAARKAGVGGELICSVW
jgi:small subunit ribosomal protein S8